MSNGPVRVTSDGVSGSGVARHQACDSLSWCPAYIVSWSADSSCSSLLVHLLLLSGLCFTPLSRMWLLVLRVLGHLDHSENSQLLLPWPFVSDPPCVGVSDPLLDSCQSAVFPLGSSMLLTVVHLDRAGSADNNSGGPVLIGEWNSACAARASVELNMRSRF